MSRKIPERVDELIEKKKGIRLDIACGRSKQGPNWVGIDMLPLPGVDIVHNIELTPWPLPDESVSVAIASHIMEHLNPMADNARLDGLVHLLVQKGVIAQEEVDQYLGNSGPIFIRVMNEIWRVMQPGGQLAMVMPFAGSPGFFRDPTHINNINEETWDYFSPVSKIYGHALWQFYEPKPWAIEQNMWNSNGNLEVALKKLPDIYKMNGQELVVEEVK
jgi:hypothetical protein